MQNQEIQSWQGVLQRTIHSTRERERLATALGVHKITLTRWASGNSRPQLQVMAHLVKVLQPRDRMEFLAALQATDPEMYDKLQEETSDSVSPSFIREVLRSRATTIESLRPWQLSATILDEAIKILDPNKLGMAITPVLCMPPVNGAIRSLREQGGRGSYPWTVDLQHQSIFLGMNCLAGYVVQSGRIQSVRDTRKEIYIPVFSYPPELEISAAACPIWFEGKIAGCLLAASPQAEHFTQARMDLLAHFTSIFALMLKPDDFYEHRLVQLRYVPEPEAQREILKTLRSRVARIMAESGLHGMYRTNSSAEQEAWQEIEEELLQRGMRQSK